MLTRLSFGGGFLRRYTLQVPGANEADKIMVGFMKLDGFSTLELTFAPQV
jgi:hypothetical protein